MKGYVLNLARRPERLLRFLGWNRGHGLDLQVVAAVDGGALDRAELVGRGLLDAENERYTPGALGAALSHRDQWLACAAEGEPRMVFEDDACLRGDIAACLAALSPALERCDILFLGHNADAPLTLSLPDGLMSAVYFGLNGSEREFYGAFSAPEPRRPAPTPHGALMVWGCIAYAVTPRGAERLLAACFPLSSRQAVRVHAERRDVFAYGIDGMINLALQSGQVRGLVCYPPLAISPNDLSDISSRPLRR